MTDTDTRTASPLSGIAGGPAAQRLKGELQDYLAAQAVRALTGVGRKLGESTVKLNDMAEGRSPGLARMALEGGRKLAEGKGPLRGAVEVGAGHLKEKVKEAFKSLGGKGRKAGSAGRRPTVILESVDIGVPVADVYEQWCKLEEFSRFAKGVQSVSEADEDTSDWKLKIFWSTRSWKAKVTDREPEARIAWTSEGAKGTTKGVVTFHPLGDDLTRVLLLIEYYPKGLFERTGNLWRAQGRRARLDLKHFARHTSLTAVPQEKRADEDDEYTHEYDEHEGDGEHEGEHEGDGVAAEEPGDADYAEADEDAELTDEADDEYADEADDADFEEEEEEGEGEEEERAEDRRSRSGR
ncbi:SRPBCC family protein [Streptomyces sp. NPDC050504]|uniref:SRPBCC family protein n=1 Tax=Streptomyces sp. NPDC050504 TaxID=3365618 RepID=UPI00378B0EE9